MSACRSCGGPVIFVPSAKSGRTMILDAKPTKGVVLSAGSPSLAGSSLDGRDRRASVVDVYTDHHATCPNAEDWKGRTRAASGVGG